MKPTTMCNNKSLYVVVLVLVAYCSSQYIAVAVNTSYLLEPSSCATSAGVEACISLDAAHKTKKYPSTLEFYVHSAATTTSYILQPSNPSSSGDFGQLAVFDYTITSTPDASSHTLGSIRGLEVWTSSSTTSFISILALNTVTYDDGVYSGTFSLHGNAIVNLTNYRIPCVGGTDDFAGVSGYSNVSKYLPNPTVFIHKLHFL
eukprot:c24183_g1_i1 orf=286-894(+)